MGRKSITKKDQEILNQITRCAFLAALGDGKFTEEESEELNGGIQSYLQGIYQQKKAIQHFEETKDFDSSIKLKNQEAVTHLSLGVNMGLFGPVPPFIQDLYDKRYDAKDVEDIIILTKYEASKISDPFSQNLAVNICHEVCLSKGDLMDGELISIRTMCEEWECSFAEAISWLGDYVLPIALEERPAQEEDTSRPVSNITINLYEEILDAALSGEDIDLEDMVSKAVSDIVDLNKNEDYSLLPIQAKLNSFKQAVACIYCCSFGSGDLSQEEADGIEDMATSLSLLYDWPDDEQNPFDLAIDAADEVLDNFLGVDGYYLGGTLPSGIMLKNIRKLAKNITDNKLQKVALYLGKTIAGQDGLDGDEEKVIEALRKAWDLEWADVEGSSGD